MYVLISLIYLFSGSTSIAGKGGTFECEAYCRYRNKQGTIRRELLEKKASSRDRAWKLVRSACAKMGKGGELQVSEPDFSPLCTDSEPAHCSQPEFLIATAENACRANSPEQRLDSGR